MPDSTTEKLFRALVVGGAMLSFTACSTPAQQKTKAAPASKTEKADNCDALCSGGQGGELFCPDPSQNGTENCCWLMAQRHPCCGDP